jgi:hypothetical protein
MIWVGFICPACVLSCRYRIPLFVSPIRGYLWGQQLCRKVANGFLTLTHEFGIFYEIRCGKTFALVTNRCMYFAVMTTKNRESGTTPPVRIRSEVCNVGPGDSIQSDIELSQQFQRIRWDAFAGLGQDECPGSHLILLFMRAGLRSATASSNPLSPSG